MHIGHKLEVRISESRRLLALEVEHLQQVLAARLDTSWSQRTMDSCWRYIESLELRACPDGIDRSSS